jgi:hypothetical protein
LSKHKVPENCDRLFPPSINHEIYKILDKRARAQDKYLVDIQNLVATGMVPIIKLVDLLKSSLASKPEAKSLFSEAITLLGQVQFNLSLRRRYLIRPNLRKKYRNLCNFTTPVTNQLFGDDISKEIKNCDLGLSLGKERNDFKSYKMRGSSYRGNFKRGQGRYQPYNQNQSYTNYASGYNARQRGNFVGRRFGRGSKATATVSTPNE